MMPSRGARRLLCGWGCLMPLLLLAGCAPAPDDAAAARGQQLLARYHCGSCHSIPGVAAARAQLAPSLQAYGRRSYIAGRLPNRPDTLARWVADPAAVIPGTLMPNMGVSPADADDMAAYLSRLQ